MVFESAQDPAGAGDRVDEDCVEQGGEVVRERSGVPGTLGYGLELGGQAICYVVQSRILGLPPSYLREVTVELANARVVQLLALHLHVERHPLGQLGGYEDPRVALGIDHLV